MSPETEQRIAFNLSVFAVPVIPGPDGTRRPEHGEPGHLERLIYGGATRGSWPLADRWKDITR